MDSYSTSEQDLASLQRQASAMALFLRQHEWLWRAHVVDFFLERMWERVDDEWNGVLRRASIRTLLHLPSGVVQEEWVDSLKVFVRTAFQLSLSREQAEGASSMSYSGLPQAPISNVLGQGMSAKKLHEIGILAAFIAGTAKCRGAQDVIDVGAGQGYLALVLAFEYRLSVVAVDACAHHAEVTNKRALRIQKYYKARSRKALQEGFSHDPHDAVRGPQTVTCRVGPGESPAPLPSLLSALSPAYIQDSEGSSVEALAGAVEEKGCRVVLAGLHACGDLSATMLRTFVECKEVAAVVNVGCCYNLLSDEDTKDTNGFPMSATVRNLGLQLGRSARDLACQSAERWKEGHPAKATPNFELHAFRAALQLILCRHYPETAIKSPSVGRAGKSRRRRQARQLAAARTSTLSANSTSVAESKKENMTEVTCPVEVPQALDEEEPPTGTYQSWISICSNLDVDEPSPRLPEFQQATRFEQYARDALKRLHLPPAPDSTLESVWREVSPHQDLVGPFYALRAVLAPVLESYILLDRLLYLKEQAGVCGMTAELVPLFDAAISPRNMAIVAHRQC